MADIFHYTGDEKLRVRITAAELEAVPEAYRAAYLEADDDSGDLVLATRIANYVTTALAEIADLKAKVEKLQTQGPMKLEAERKARREERVNATLHAALAKAGVKPGLLEGAMELLKGQNEFEVEPSDDGKRHVVLARTANGLHSVDSIVSQLMDGEAGAAWRDKRTAPSAGYFTGLLSGLKERR